MKLALFTTIDFDRQPNEKDEDVVGRCSKAMKSLATKLPKDVESCWMIEGEDGLNGVRLHVLGTYWNGAGADNGRARLLMHLTEEAREGGQEPQFELTRSIGIYGLDEAQEGIDPTKGSSHI